jgi:hypothetical protein
MIGQTMNETAQATSGRLSLITVSIKDVVKNFDTFTEGILRGLYAWNMEFNPRKDIKGDFKVKARGVSSLVMKEIRMQALTQLTSTMTPGEWDYVPEGELVKQKFSAHDLDIKLRTDEQVAKLRQEREQSVQNQLAIKMAEAEIKYKESQTLAQLTKAKDKNVEANIKAQAPPEGQETTDPRLTEAEIATQQAETAKKNADIQAKNADTRRQEEAHAVEMSHKDEAHRVKLATDATKTAHDMELKEKKHKHDMEMKEKALAKAEANRKNQKKR